MPHLDEGQITALLDGEMTATEKVEAESHLTTCAECRQLLDETRGFFQEAGALIDAVQPRTEAPNRPVGPVLHDTPVAVSDRRAAEPPNRRGGGMTAWRSLGWAASIVVAVGLGWFASDLRYGRRPAAISDMKPARAAQAVMPAQSAEPIVTAPEDPPHATPPASAVFPDKPALPRRDEAAARRSGPPAAPAAPVPEVGIVSDRTAAMDQVAKLAESTVERRDAEERVVAGRTELQANRPAPSAFGVQAPAGAAQAAEADSRRARTSVRAVTLEEAVRSLGGTIRLVDGMVPARVELMESARPGNSWIRVVYLDLPGRELWLDQERLIVTGGALARELDDRSGLLAGDTLAVAGPGGRQALSWMDHGVLRLGLTGFLPADSLRGLARRIR